jgi:hypothetical protein
MVEKVISLSMDNVNLRIVIALRDNQVLEAAPRSR